MRENQISINLESLQDRLASTSQIYETLSAIRKIGYEYVETLHSINPDCGTSWQTVLKQVDLKASSIHELLTDIEANPEAMIEKALKLECKYIAVGLARNVIWENIESVKRLTESLNNIGRMVKDAGLRLLYHNHNMEFYKLSSNETCMEYIFDNTIPSMVGAELDAYWVQLSGDSPTRWCKKLTGRLKAVHLKDLGVTGGSYEVYIKTPICKELGGGNLDISGIIKAAESVGNEWYIVETHTNWLDGDSLKTAEASYNYLKSLVS